jgi:hypothetical protein
MAADKNNTNASTNVAKPKKKGNSDDNDNGIVDLSTLTTATTAKKNITTIKQPRRETIIPTNLDTIAKKIGYIVEEFKCNHNNFQGILYSGPLGLIFLGRILLFEWTVVLKWDDVVKVCMKHPPNWNKSSSRSSSNNNNNKVTTTAAVTAVEPPFPLNSGITIETRGVNAMKYDFEKFFDASKALSILVSLHNDSILDLTPRAMPTPRVVSRGLRRMNSDPLRISNLFNFDDLPTTLEQEENDALRNAGWGGRSLYGVDDDENETTSIGHSLDAGSNRVSLLDAHPVALVRANTFDVSRRNRFDREPPNVDTDQTTASSLSNQQSCRRSGTEDTEQGNEVDVATQWQQAVNDIANYTEHPIKDLEVLCNLNQFVEAFVDNDATYSIAQFMKQNGEMDVNVSQWVKDPTDRLAMKRSIEYTHPVDVPMAPPTARARKEQTYRRYGDRGLIFETKTYVSDVPMTDCFYVADVMRVEAPQEKNGKKVLLNMHFDIRFVKSTMFRSLIARTTKSEFEKSFHTMANFVSTNLVDRIDGPLLPTTETPSHAPASESQSVVGDAQSRLPTILIVLVLMMQIWILVDVRLVKLELRQIAAEISIVDRVQTCQVVPVQSYAVDGDA